jgi:hypothetical protein
VTFPPGAGRPDGARRAQPVCAVALVVWRPRFARSRLAAVKWPWKSTRLSPHQEPYRDEEYRALAPLRARRYRVLRPLRRTTGRQNGHAVCTRLQSWELVPFRLATAVPRTGQRGASHGSQASRARAPPDGRRSSARRSEAGGPACEADPRSPSSGLAGAACRRAPQSARDVSGPAACPSFRVSTGGPRIADGLQEALVWLNSASRVGRRQVRDEAALRCGAVAMGESVLPHDHRLWSSAGG